MRVAFFSVVIVCFVVAGCNQQKEDSPQSEVEQNEPQQTKAESTDTQPKQQASKENSADQASPRQSKSADESSEKSSARSSPSSDTRTSTQNGNGKQLPNPSETHSLPSDEYSRAASLREKAREYSSRGDNQAAYEATLAAWETIRKQSTDKASKNLSAELLKDMEKYGEGLVAPEIENVLKKPVRYE